MNPINYTEKQIEQAVIAADEFYNKDNDDDNSLLIYKHVVTEAQRKLLNKIEELYWTNDYSIEDILKTVRRQLEKGE